VAGAADLSTREISVSALRLSDELIFAPQAHGLETYYHIEAPSQGKFYRVGYPEYVFLSLLDGSRTVAQALTITARTLGSRAPSQSQGVEVANWLVENKLAQYNAGDSAWTDDGQQRSGGLLQRVNPFWMKVPFGSPGQLLTALLPGLGWMFSPWAMVAWLLLIAAGAGSVVSHWPKFIASAGMVLAPHNWLWMIVAWLLLKVVHEMSHALACKYHGGEVRDAGVILMLLAPLAYVDVTSSWRFSSRWQRIHVAAAGMFAELVIAAVAAIVWAFVDSSVAHHLLFNVIVMASLSTLLFNANPLMRFDGYYILADLLKIPNLASDGNRAVKNMGARIFFGEQRQPPQVLGFRRWFVNVYGLAAGAWRLLTCVSLATAASVLLQGAGVLLAVAGVAGWFGMPCYKLALDLLRRLHEKRPSFVRATVIGAGLAAVVTAILLWVPWPGAMKAPVVVSYAGQSVVRSTAAGFVQTVYVVDGQKVKAGQLLVTLHNDELEAKRRELQLAIDEGRARHRVAVGQHRGADAQIALRNLKAAEVRLAEISRQSEGLEVRAPLAGRIVARNLAQSLGGYVQEGAEILTVADESKKELIVSVGQQEIDAIVPFVGRQARFRIGSRFTQVGTLDRLDPRASTKLPHPAMSASVGGNLAVVQQKDAGQTGMCLVEPRFRGVISLPPDDCLSLGAGEQGHVLLGLRDKSIGEFAWIKFRGWFEKLLRPVEQRN